MPHRRMACLMSPMSGRPILRAPLPFWRSICGWLLAVRYLVIPHRRAPAGSGASPQPATADLVTALGLQIDLRTVQTDQALTVYENAAWAPERAVLSDEAAAASRSAAPRAAQDAPLADAQPVLVDGSHDHFTGPVP